MKDIVFDDKTLSDIFKDIYSNTENKREQINMFITRLVKMILTPEDAAVLSPIIKDFYEVSVKNDEQVVRVAQIAQRAMSIGAKVSTSNDILTDLEKQQLLKNISNEIDELQEEAKQVEDELVRLRA